MNLRQPILLLAAAVFLNGIFNPFVSADDEAATFFESRIRPVLIKHCYSCHSTDAKNVRGGLLLDSSEGLLDGGDSGAVINLTSPGDSLLLSSLRHESFEMPPSGKLPDTVIADFEKWIADGAFDPRAGGSTLGRRSIDMEEGQQFWSFQPIRKHSVPRSADDWARNDIDSFIHATHLKANVQPTVDATPSEILRRLSFALTGLPPTADEIGAFQVAYRKDAESAITLRVDQWLQSPRYGERWGRHWLDVTRFSESSGGGRSLLFPHAWRFRDYVIRSFQNDKPLPTLIKEHIAGDLLPGDSAAALDEQTVGAGYLVLGPNNYEQQDKELLRMDVIDEQIDTVGRTFLGMTLGCARCHDHKFDPIPSSDYYALAGIFRSTHSLEFGNVSGYVTAPLRSRKGAAQFLSWQQRMDDVTEKLKTVRSQLPSNSGGFRQTPTSADTLPGIVVDDLQAEFEGTWVASTFRKTYVEAGYQHNDNKQKMNRVHFRTRLPKAGQYEVRFAWNGGPSRSSRLPVQVHHADGVTTVDLDQRESPEDGLFQSLGEYRFEANHVAQVTVSPLSKPNGYVIVDAVQFLPVAKNNSKLVSKARLSEKRQSVLKLKQKEEQLQRQLEKLKKDKPEQPLAMTVRDRKDPADWHQHVRGEVRVLGELVARGALSVVRLEGRALGTETPFSIPTSQSGRVQLAEWISSKHNPLTRRVYVNRIWQHLIGEGLVRTPDNFGMTGQRPTHPELLDYLAATFVKEDKWSTKRLIRRICLSRTFRMSSSVTAEIAAADPENRLLGRAFRRQVDGEALRDAMLAISGELDLSITMGRTIQKITTYDNDYLHSRYPTMARSVFVPAFRNAPLPQLSIFDGVNSNLVSGRRSESTLPAQALYLMNSDFVLNRSLAAAKRLLAEQHQTTDDLIQAVCLSIVGRLPTPAEQALFVSFLGDSPPTEERLSAVVQSLFASIDFRYLD